MLRFVIPGAAAAALFSLAAAGEPGWKALPEITLQPAGLPGMCVTVNAAGIGESRSCAGTPDQVFRAPGPDGGVLRYGDLCMSAPDEGNYPELRTVTCGSGGDHYWIVDHKGRLANNAGRCLQLLGGVSAEGGRVFGARCLQDDPSPDIWRFVPVDEVWQSRIAAPIQIGDACLAWQESGNHFTAGDCTTAPHATFSYATNRPGQIRAHSACLRAYIDGAALNLGDCHDAPDQMWSIIDGRLTNGAGRCALADAKGVLRSGHCPQTPGPFAWPVSDPLP